MNSSQKIVARGAASGVITMALLNYALYQLLPTIPGIETATDRLVFALHMNVFASMPFFVMMIFVANGRFLSDAIDPTKHAESKAMEINGRVADNTLQQNFVFFVGTLALATFLDATSIKVLIPLTIVFILARIAFWIGYRMDPLYRAPGMAATSYMNLGILIASVYFFITQ